MAKKASIEVDEVNESKIEEVKVEAKADLKPSNVIVSDIEVQFTKNMKFHFRGKDLLFFEGNKAKIDKDLKKTLLIRDAIRVL